MKTHLSRAAKLAWSRLRGAGEITSLQHDGVVMVLSQGVSPTDACAALTELCDPWDKCLSGPKSSSGKTSKSGKRKQCRRCPCWSLSCSLASHLSSKVQMKPFKSSSTEYCKLTTKLATSTTSSKASRVHKIHMQASAAHRRCRRCRRCRLCSRHRHHIHAMAAICCRHLLGRCCRRHRRHLLFMAAISRRRLTCRC